MGGEPERDEGGLPPVDIEIPDDARELDRDVHAYYRELRAQRRRRRVERIITPFTRHGMVVPVIAGTLALTLFAGTMLTVITSAPEPSSVPAPRITAPISAPASTPPSTPPSTPQATPAAGKLGGPLPTAAVWIDNKQTPLSGLSPAVLAVVPPVCHCLVTLRQLTEQAAATQVKIYFVGTGSGVKQLASLAAQVGHGTVQVVDDRHNVLAAYRPTGVTAILVRSDKAVTSIHRGVIPGFSFRADLERLAAPGAGYPASPAPT
ncbi:MAG TPA: hypothetical protein VKD26_00175 [Streptosporangiaceae bacterium]|nr:hypothetical protein [Streptosporangiaceae bacterium]